MTSSNLPESPSAYGAAEHISLVADDGDDAHRRVLTAERSRSIAGVPSSHQRTRRTGNLTDLQVSLLVEQFSSQARRILEILDMFNRYADAGGRDWASYERIFDHLSREGMKLVQYSHSAVQPLGPRPRTPGTRPAGSGRGG